MKISEMTMRLREIYDKYGNLECWYAEDDGVTSITKYHISLQLCSESMMKVF